MKKRTVFIRFLSFALIFIVLFYVVTEVLKDKRVELEYDVTAKVKGFYEEPENTLDFVFIGSSQLYASIAPNVLFDEYGITSYDFCANEQPLWISYYYIKEALKHQKPKAIVLDVFTVYGDQYEENGVNHINLDDLPWNRNKLTAIKHAVSPAERMEFYFEIIQYHDTWAQLDKDKIKNTFYHKKNVYKGYSPFVTVHDYEKTANEEIIRQKERQQIPERALIWLNKIVDLTEKEGVELLLIKTPNGSVERQKLYNSVEDFALEKGVPFLNMNLLFDGEAHINMLQAEKVTSFLGQYLTEHYEVTDKRNEPAFASWHEDGRYFTQKKKKCQLINTVDTSDYLSLVKGSNTIKLIAVKSDEAHPLNGQAIKRLGELGIDTQHLQQFQPFQVGLFLLNEENEILLETYVNDKDRDVVSETVSYQNHEWELSYDASFEKKQTVLGMDGDNYSLDRYGINLFLYDPLLEEIDEFVLLSWEQNFELDRE